MPPVPPPLPDAREESGSEDEGKVQEPQPQSDVDEENAADVDEGINELMDTFADDEEEIDLTHLRIHSTRSLNLPRFARTLQRLVLRQNQITKIRRADFEPLTELRELDLYDNLIEHVGGLDNCTKLEVLDLSFNNIRHMSNVSHLGACHTLYFVQNKIARVRPDDLVGPIAHSLKSLELGGNRLRSMEHLGHLQHLEELWVGKNKITSFDHIAPLQNLRVLSIQSNRITSLAGLAPLVNLEELYLSHNGVESLAGLEHNVNLNTLDIAANKVSSLEGIAHLSKLNQFWANDNLLEDINHLDAYLGPARMPHLETVYLEGNPAQRKEGAAYRRKVLLALPQIIQLDATMVRR